MVGALMPELEMATNPTLLGSGTSGAVHLIILTGIGLRLGQWRPLRGYQPGFRSGRRTTFRKGWPDG